jgi:transposase-like protein
MKLTMNSEPKTLLEAVRYYSDKNRCVNLLASIRWENGVTCPVCASKEITAFKTRQIWKCRTCKKQFSVKVGTIFEKSQVSLEKWFVCAWLLTNAKNGISSCEVARSLGVTQKTAWFMLHRIREAHANRSFEKLSGVVESDSTFVGGLDKNRHANKKKDVQGGGGKAIVFGVVERGGEVRSQVVEGTNKQNTENDVLSNVAIGSTLYTDEAPGYHSLGIVYEHETVNHRDGEYVRYEKDGTVITTNTIENYWSLVKRCIKGTYIHVEPFHLNRYLDEQGFRYDTRKTNDSTRFLLTLGNVTGRRLTYATLTNHE